MLAWSAPSLQIYFADRGWYWTCFVFLGVFACLIIAKVVFGIALVLYAADAQRRDIEYFNRNPTSSYVPPTAISGSAYSTGQMKTQSSIHIDSKETDADKIRERIEYMEELSSMERYTVYKGRVL